MPALWHTRKWKNGKVGEPALCKKALIAKADAAGITVRVRRSGKAVTTTLMPDRRIRVLVAKSGLDGHDRGAKIVTRSARRYG